MQRAVAQVTRINLREVISGKAFALCADGIAGVRIVSHIFLDIFPGLEFA
jgi:hypothetical protein